jgi:hypothetical protein
LKGEIEKKNNFNKKIKKNQKNNDQIEKKIISHKFRLKDEIENQ